MSGGMNLQRWMVRELERECARELERECLRLLEILEILEIFIRKAASSWKSSSLRSAVWSLDKSLDKPAKWSNDLFKICFTNQIWATLFGALSSVERQEIDAFKLKVLIFWLRVWAGRLGGRFSDKMNICLRWWLVKSSHSEDPENAKLWLTTCETNWRCL